MRRGMKRPAVRRLVFLGLAFVGLSLLAATAQACPMCNQSIAEEDLLPHAYMYSILFMLAMPAVVFTGIGSAIYLQFRKHSPDATAADSDGAEQF